MDESFDSFDLNLTFDKACQTEPQLLYSCFDNKFIKQRLADEKARLLAKRKAFKSKSLPNEIKIETPVAVKASMGQKSIDTYLPVILESNESPNESRKISFFSDSEKFSESSAELFD